MSHADICKCYINMVIIVWAYRGNRRLYISNDSSFAAMLHKRSPTRRWVLPLKFVPDRKVHKDTMFSASKSHFFEEMFIFHSRHLAGLLSDQLKSWNSLYAHLQEQSLGGEVSVSLALLWLVEAAHPTRLRCFLWASGGRSCHCAQVSDYTHALSLQKPPLLLINDTLKESIHTALFPHTETLKNHKDLQSTNVCNVGK